MQVLNMNVFLLKRGFLGNYQQVYINVQVFMTCSISTVQKCLLYRKIPSLLYQMRTQNYSN